MLPSISIASLNVKEVGSFVATVHYISYVVSYGGGGRGLRTYNAANVQ